MKTLKIKPKTLMNYLKKLNYDNYNSQIYDDYTLDQYKSYDYEIEEEELEKDFRYALIVIVKEYLNNHINKTRPELAHHIEDTKTDYYEFYNLINPSVIKLTPSIKNALKTAFKAHTIDEVIEKHPYLYRFNLIDNPINTDIENIILLRPQMVNEDDFLFLNKIDTLELTKTDIVYLSTDELLTQFNYSTNNKISKNFKYLTEKSDDILLSIANTQIKKLITVNRKLKKEFLKYKLIDDYQKLDDYLYQLSKLSYTYINDKSLYSLLNKTPNENKIEPVSENINNYMTIYHKRVRIKPLLPLYINKTYKDNIKLLEKHITDNDLKQLEYMLNKEES